MKSRPWRDTNLMGHGIGLARSKGLARRRNQFYGFSRHPWHIGRIDWNSLTCLASHWPCDLCQGARRTASRFHAQKEDSRRLAGAALPCALDPAAQRQRAVPNATREPP